MILTLWKIQTKTLGSAFVNCVRHLRITSWQIMPPMHYSVHGDGQIFLQKSGQQIAIAWDVKYLSSTGLLSVISVTRDDPKNDAWRSKNAKKNMDAAGYEFRVASTPLF
jgi:hypothetical protein